MKIISDEQLKAYFLGKLAEAEAEAVEMQCAFSPELFERAQTVERELADDFLRGNLSAEETRLFETVYLLTRRRRNRLQTAKGLWLMAEVEPQVSADVATQSVFGQNFFGGRKAFRLAFGILLLLTIFGGAFYYLSDREIKGDEVARINTPEQRAEIENQTPPDSVPENRNAGSGAVNAALPENRETDQNANSPEKNPPAAKPAPTPKNNETNPAAAFMLYPGTLRSEGEQVVALSPNAQSLNLQLKLPADALEYEIYRVVLKPVEGAPLFTTTNLKSFSLTIPAAALENRTYLVFLEGKNKDTEFEPVAEYSFRVRR